IVSTVLLKLLLGSLANIFILMVNAVGIWQGRSLPAIDLITISIVLTNLLIQASVFYMLINMLLQSWALAKLISFIFMTATQGNIWFTTWLFVYYFIKIANFSCRLFIQLKQQIARVVPCLVSTSMMFSLCSSGIMVFYSLPTSLWNTTIINGADVLSNNISTNGIPMNVYVTGAVIYSIPFTAMSVTSSILIMFLRQHTRRLMTISDGFSRARLAAYFRIAERQNSAAVDEEDLECGPDV
ncbi:taste receptor type 2 member 125-like, partial [Protopterus annectens]|uniref:taste receptor type 2 member 125-like n=1 Tax=Protopterus annectens TaxID=7888 RepID=UPI001CFA0133